MLAKRQVSAGLRFAIRLGQASPMASRMKEGAK